MNEILASLLILLGYIITGYTINKFGLLDFTSDKYFSNFLLKVTLPATIIASAIGIETDNKLSAIYVLAVATFIFILVPILSTILVKKFKLDDTYKMMFTYPNLGFMGMPIIATLYGPTGMFYASLFMIVFNLSIFSYGMSVMNKGSKFDLKKLLSPGIISALIAVIIFFFSIPVPDVLTSFLNKVGGITSPLAMITLGSTLRAVHIRDVVKEKILYVFSFLKLIVFPFIIWFILQFFIKDPLILGVSVILSSLPVASNVTMFCIIYDGNKELAVKGTYLSTILSFITIPIYMILFAL